MSNTFALTQPQFRRNVANEVCSGNWIADYWWYWHFLLGLQALVSSFRKARESQSYLFLHLLQPNEASVFSSFHKQKSETLHVCMSAIWMRGLCGCRISKWLLLYALVCINKSSWVTYPGLKYLFLLYLWKSLSLSSCFYPMSSGTLCSLQVMFPRA